MTSFGVVPWFAGAGRLPREDAFDIHGDNGWENSKRGAIKIAVPVFSRIANFDDLDPLRAEPDVSVVMVRAGEALPGDADLVLLPGSKATLADLAFVREQGWDIDLAAHVRRGSAVLGICGGYQMLGKTVADPDGVEGEPAEALGLGLLDIQTTLTAKKKLIEVSGTDLVTGEAVSGYEMHVGVTTGPDTKRPMLSLTVGKDGALSADGRVSGSYVHGLFASDNFRMGFLQKLRPGVQSVLKYEMAIDEALEALADHLELYLNLDAMINV
jgi:adenosylcobyric acid synthase